MPRNHMKICPGSHGMFDRITKDYKLEKTIRDG
jgi:hypothetical protein